MEIRHQLTPTTPANDAAPRWRNGGSQRVWDRRQSPCARHVYAVDHGFLSDVVRNFHFADLETGRLKVRSLKLGQVVVAEVGNSGHAIALRGLGGATWLAPLVGRDIVQTSQGKMETPPGGGGFLRPGDEETTVLSDGARPFRGVVVLAPPPAGWRAAAGADAGRWVAADPDAAAIQRLATYLLALAADPDSPLLTPAAKRSAEALLTNLLATLDRFDAPPAWREAAASGRVDNAVAYIRAHVDEPLTVAAAARALGMSERALQAGFRARLGRSPREALAEARLERARARLLAAAPGATVADIAYASGFAHLGCSASAYRKRIWRTTISHARGLHRGVTACARAMRQ